MGFLFATNSGATGATGATGPAGTSIVDEVFNAEDDGFDVSSLNAKWTQSTSGTAPTVVINSQEARSCYLAKFAGSATGSVKIAQAYAPAGDFSLTFKLSSVFRSGANTAISLVLKNAANTEQVLIQFVGVTAASTASCILFSFADPTLTNRGSIVSFSSRIGPLYGHIQRVGSTWTALLSFDGQSWQPLSGTTTQSVTVNELFIEITQSAATKEFSGLDWIRRDWFVW